MRHFHAIKMLIAAVCLLLATLANGQSISANDSGSASGQASQEQRTEDQIKPRLKIPIIIRCGRSYPPFEFVNEKGELDGFNPEIIKAIMKEVKLPYDLDCAEWRNVVDSLKNCQIDMVAGITYTSKRNDEIAYGMTLANVKQVLVVKADSPYRNLKSLYGRLVAVQGGGYAQSMLEDVEPNIKLLCTHGTADAFDSLLAGRCDAAIINESTVKYLQRKHKIDDIMVLESGIEPNEYRIACNKEVASALLPMLNRGLYKLHRNGQYDAIYEKWFGENQTQRNLRYSLWGIGGGLLLLILTIIALRLYYKRFRHAVSHIEEQNVHLQANEDVIRKVFDLVPTPIYVVNVNDNHSVYLANKCAQQELGLHLGVRLSDVLTPTSEYASKIDDFEVLEKGAKINHRRTLELIKRGAFEARIFKEPITLSGMPMVLSVLWRIDDFVKTQDELIKAKNTAESNEKRQSAFLATMSHEIRNSLNVILGFSRMMNEEDLEKGEMTEFARMVDISAQQLQDLLNDILDLSKLDANMMTLNPEKFDFSEFFDNLAKVYAKQMEGKPVAFTADNPHSRCMVYMDRIRVSQILNNFMTNAIKFTPKGRITMGYHSIDNGVYIYVSDTGIGIDYDKQKLVFNKYHQLNTYAKGTGLGLAICKSIVEIAHGQIGFESHPGEGSKFYAYLPNIQKDSTSNKKPDNTITSTEEKQS